MKQIGTIHNYYGKLYVSEKDGKYYWCIENYDGCLNWEQIPRYLYDALLRFEKTNDTKRNN